LFVEVLATFIFINVILTVKYHFGSKELILNGGIIGMTLFAMITISGAISGGCLNPAIGIVQTVF
jgi:glycerol uptake facilitator-like aquaporin